MDENKSIFQKALSRFTHEFANGDVIRKYAESGYSIPEIQKHLDFPTPAEQVRKIAWNHLLETGQILLGEPGFEDNGRYEYVKEVSPYGRTSFRKVKIEEEEDISWKVVDCEPDKLNNYLEGVDDVMYAQIPFGLLRYQDSERYQKMLETLPKKEADFIDSFFVERKCVYYRLNRRMARILKRLMENGLYHGKFYPSACDGDDNNKTDSERNYGEKSQVIRRLLERR